MENPFLYGSPVEGEHFINRTKELASLVSDLSRGQNVIVFSPRRFGKTSLLKEALRKLSKKGISVFYMDLYTVTSAKCFCDLYAANILSKIQEPSQKLFKFLSTAISVFRPRLVFAEPGIPSLQIEVGPSVLKQAGSVSQLLDALQQFMKKKKRKACVVFDEFQEIMRMEDGESLEKQLRSSLQHHANVSYAFLGSQQHMMLTLFRDKSRPFYNFGRKYQLGAINDSDWLEYIIGGFRKSGIRPLPDDVQRVIDLSEGHPYYAQMLACELWDTYRSSPKRTDKFAELTLAACIQKEEHAFHEIWDTLNPKSRVLLQHIAREKSVAVYSIDSLAKMGITNGSSIQRTVKKLEDTGQIQRTNGVYQVSDPLFARWLAAN